MTEPSLSVSVAKPIYWVGGSKGGVGKSMLSIAVLDYLLHQGEKVFLIESDTSNPDVWKSYHEEATTAELVNLNEGDGWVRIINVCDAHSDHTVVINTGARNNVEVTQHGQTLDHALEELGRPLVALWVINRQRDSLELLRQFMSAVPHALVHVVRNAYLGAEGKYELYNGSSLRRDVIEARGGLSVTLPELADRVADDLYTNRLSITAASKALPIGNRAELWRWRNEVHKALAPVLGGKSAET